MLLTAVAANAQTADPEPGVPRELARWRAAHYSNISYRMEIRLAPGAPMLQGQETIRLTLNNSADRIILDWRVNPVKEGQPRPRVWDIKLNGSPAPGAREVNEHIIIPNAKPGTNEVSLNFESPVSTSGSAVTRYLDREDNSEYIYTLFVPSDASTAFPCFDQPDLKASFTLALNTPAGWNAVSNTTVMFYANPLPATGGAESHVPPGTRTALFQATEPISTYLFAFAAGPFVKIEEFAAETAEASTYPPPKAARRPSRVGANDLAPMNLYVRKSRHAQAMKEAAEVFRLNRECVGYLADYFDYKFPFPKYDLIIVPEFAYRGMEHAGATFLREESILFPTTPTANDFLSRANVIFHEAAHQWFGDLVTMRWFDDLWLKEGFAEFMSFKALEAIMPEFDAWKAFYERTKPAAYLTDSTKGTTPIFQEIPNLSAAKSAYGNIVYRKAPSILRQAEFYLEPRKFQKGVRQFVRKHAYANAEWADLVRAFEQASGAKLGVWSDSWVKRRGMPDVRLTYGADANSGDLLLTLTQSDVLGEGGFWPMRIKIAAVYEGSTEIHDLVLNEGGRKTFNISSASNRGSRLLYVFGNHQDFGYGRFLLNRQSREYVLEHLGEEKDSFQRALLWGSLWDSVREAELAPAEYIELAIRTIGVERDEVTVQSILNRVSIALNAYSTKEQAAQVAPRLEQILLDGMLKSETVGLRITFFRAFQTMAVTDSARAELKKILDGSLVVPGLQLRPRDRFDIVTQLLARGDRDAPALLEGLQRTETSDDAKRYAYAAAAAIGTEANKKKYFDAYLNDPKLAESWIEASVNPFNSVVQSELTLSYLQPALAELPKLKRTRKIFFVNQWLGAFVGGQCDPRALETVQLFLKTNEQTLDRDLRLKVLEAMDPLERCVKIRRQKAEERSQK
jgi:aminopeptidase N